MNYKTKFELHGYFCNACRKVIQAEIQFSFPYLNFSILTSPAIKSVICERCGHEDRSHPNYQDYKETMKASEGKPS